MRIVKFAGVAATLASFLFLAADAPAGEAAKKSSTSKALAGVHKVKRRPMRLTDTGQFLLARI